MAITTKLVIGELLYRINEGATNSSTPLGDVMRLCLRLGRLLNNQELSNWAKAEAGGYEDTGALPDYRIFETEVRATFLGPFGSSLSNISIPQAVVEEAHRDTLFNVSIMQPVGELERLVSGNANNHSLTFPWSGNTIMYYQRKELYEDYALASAGKVLTTATMVGVLETIRARVVEFVLMIEKELGIDIMDYDNNKKPLEAPAQEKVSQIFNTTIHGGSNFALGNSGTTNQQAIQVQPGDLKGLKEKLTQLGVPDVLVSDLDTALSKDADSEEQPGQHVQGWFGRLATKVGTGAVQLAGTATALAVMTEVKRFLGLPPV